MPSLLQLAIDKLGIEFQQLDLSFHGQEKIAWLNSNPALAEIDAVKYGQLHALGIKHIFPGIGVIKTVQQMSQWFEAVSNKKLAKELR